mmetsp:Transcript_16682/g.65177  ORF Transcript_16682/g.65177 Transcript_16682/m.65177 type:complete len:241 (+) Transcript_16682:1424-2146(+)
MTRTARRSGCGTSSARTRCRGASSRLPSSTTWTTSATTEGWSSRWPGRSPTRQSALPPTSSSTRSGALTRASLRSGSVDTESRTRPSTHVTSRSPPSTSNASRHSLPSATRSPLNGVCLSLRSAPSWSGLAPWWTPTVASCSCSTGCTAFCRIPGSMAASTPTRLSACCRARNRALSSFDSAVSLARSPFRTSTAVLATRTSSSTSAFSTSQARDSPTRQRRRSGLSPRWSDCCASWRRT